MKGKEVFVPSGGFSQRMIKNIKKAVPQHKEDPFCSTISNYTMLVQSLSLSMTNPLVKFEHLSLAIHQKARVNKTSKDNQHRNCKTNPGKLGRRK